MKGFINFAALTGATTILFTAASVTPVCAWHPKGTIIKYVTNQSTGGQMSDANDATHAVSAKPGDILKYTIIVTNTAATDSKGYNDLYYTSIVDELPDGIERTDDSNAGKFTADLGKIAPGEKKTAEFTVKVKDNVKDKAVITNTACFTGDSQVKDNKQSGCDKAIVVVTVPKQPETPQTPAPPTPVPETPKPTVLPNTGVGNLLVPAGAATGLGYAANLLRLKRRSAKANR